MTTKIRIGGKWVNMENNTVTETPDGLTGSWTSTNKTFDTVYTNGESSVIYVSAVFRVRTINSESVTVTAGSSAWAWVSDPGETGTNLSNYNNICRVRDNGTADAENLYLNARFFVPPGSKYGCKLYNATNQDNLGSRRTTLSWKEFAVELKIPDNTTTSLDPNSNNFQRTLKASSITTNFNWSDFMQDFAVWIEPGNVKTFGQAYSTTYTINITKAGDYTLEYGMDDSGTITFDGTQVASAVKSDATYANDPPSSVTLQNVSTGSHTLVATVTNQDNSPNSNNWDNNPAGIAWRLKPFGT
jgi:hypothetical protein